MMTLLLQFIFLEIWCGLWAKTIGKPTAQRAVAQACGANKLAIAVPCHRIVRSNGELGGYRWGIERKKQLLNQEKDVTDISKQRQ